MDLPKLSVAVLAVVVLSGCQSSGWPGEKRAEQPRKGLFGRMAESVGIGRDREAGMDEPIGSAAPSAPVSAPETRTEAEPASQVVIENDKPVESPAEPAAEKKGWLQKAGGMVGLGRKDDSGARKETRNAQGLVLQVEPPGSKVSLSESWNLPVHITLRNEGKKPVILKFSTSQKIEIFVKDATGKTVVNWAEDRSFAQAKSQLLINPLERAEYEESVSLRDLSAGKTYTIEVGIVGYADLLFRHSFTVTK